MNLYTDEATDSAYDKVYSALTVTTSNSNSRPGAKGMYRVKPGDSEASLLWIKIAKFTEAGSDSIPVNASGSFGARMPKLTVVGGSVDETKYLSADDKALIKSWIDRGAPKD
jgi:hypothetical protein